VASGRSARRGCRNKEMGTPRSKTSKQEMDMGVLRFVEAAGAKIFGATETGAEVS
jgi:hypothetical protein